MNIAIPLPTKVLLLVFGLSGLSSLHAQVETKGDFKNVAYYQKLGFSESDSQVLANVSQLESKRGPVKIDSVLSDGKVSKIERQFLDALDAIGKSLALAKKRNEHSSKVMRDTAGKIPDEIIKNKLASPAWAGARSSITGNAVTWDTVCVVVCDDLISVINDIMKSEADINEENWGRVSERLIEGQSKLDKRRTDYLQAEKGMKDSVVKVTSIAAWEDLVSDLGFRYGAFNITGGEQGGADQPATAPESKPEGSPEPKPEAEERSQ